MTERDMEDLIKKYPHLKQIIGKGDLIDNAKAAEAVATG